MGRRDEGARAEKPQVAPLDLSHPMSTRETLSTPAARAPPALGGGLCRAGAEWPERCHGCGNGNGGLRLHRRRRTACASSLSIVNVDVEQRSCLDSSPSTEGASRVAASVPVVSVCSASQKPTGSEETLGAQARAGPALSTTTQPRRGAHARWRSPAAAAADVASRSSVCPLAPTCATLRLPSFPLSRFCSSRRRSLPLGAVLLHAAPSEVRAIRTPLQLR